MYFSDRISLFSHSSILAILFPICPVSFTPFYQVSMFMTGSMRSRRSLKSGSFNDYKDLALASGGQAIEVSKSQLPQATDIILDTSTSALVNTCSSQGPMGHKVIMF